MAYTTGQRITLLCVRGIGALVTIGAFAMNIILGEENLLYYTSEFGVAAALIINLLEIAALIRNDRHDSKSIHKFILDTIVWCFLPLTVAITYGVFKAQNGSSLSSNRDEDSPFSMPSITLYLCLSGLHFIMSIVDFIQLCQKDKEHEHLSEVTKVHDLYSVERV